MARTQNLILRAAIAIAPGTSLDVIDTLTREAEPFIRSAYLRRTRNLRPLKAILRKAYLRQDKHGDPSGDSVNACRNANVPIGLLIQMLKHPDANIALAAFCNPSTPESARRNLTPQQAGTLVGTGLTPGGQEVRANELVLANPWMLENPAIGWCGDIRRAFTNSPTATKSVLLAVKDTNDIHIEKHPAYRGVDVTTLDVNALLGLETGVSDLIAINKPEFTETDAMHIINRASRVDGHIAGRLINRYGIGMAQAYDKRAEWHEIISTMWLAPLLGWSKTIHEPHHATVEDERQNALISIKLLDDNQHNWETLVDLLPNWHGTVLEAVKTACKL